MREHFTITLTLAVRDIAEQPRPAHCPTLGGNLSDAFDTKPARAALNRILATEGLALTIPVDLEIHKRSKSEVALDRLPASFDPLA